jgi:ATP-dependent Zn protease
MTPTDLRQTLEQRRALNEELERLIADEEQLAALTAWLESNEARQVHVSTNLPTGESLVVMLTNANNEKQRFATHSPATHLLATMLNAAISEAQAGLAARREAIVAQL